jgi:hypothetical protein
LAKFDFAVNVDIAVSLLHLIEDNKEKVGKESIVLVNIEDILRSYQELKEYQNLLLTK